MAFHLLSAVGLPLFNENLLSGVPRWLGSPAFFPPFMPSVPRFLTHALSLACLARGMKRCPRERFPILVCPREHFPFLRKAPSLELASWRTPLNPCPRVP